MYRRCDDQRGFSLIAFLFWTVIVAFFATILVKLGPVYVADWTISSVMEEVSHAPEALEGGKKGVRDQLWRRLDINDVKTVSASDFVITEAPGGSFEVSIDYEARVHLFFNIDAVLSFSHEVLVTGR